MATTSFRQPGPLTDLEIFCGPSKLYFERSLLSRAAPALLAQIRAPLGPGEYWQLRLEEKVEVLESFLRVLGDFALSCGLRGPSYETVDRGLFYFPLEKAERMPFVEFCLRRELPHLAMAFFWEDKNDIEEMLALYRLAEQHGSCLEDREAELKSLRSQMASYLCEDELPAGSKLPLWVFRQAWAEYELGQLEVQEAAQPGPGWKYVRAQKEKLLRNALVAGYSELEVGASKLP